MTPNSIVTGKKSQPKPGNSVVRRLFTTSTERLALFRAERRRADAAREVQAGEAKVGWVDSGGRMVDEDEQNFLVQDLDLSALGHGVDEPAGEKGDANNGNGLAGGFLEGLMNLACIGLGQGDGGHDQEHTAARAM